MNTVERLKKAYELVKAGWTKYDECSSGSYCAIGGIRYASGDQTRETGTFAEGILAEAINGEPVPSELVWFTITRWNDDEKRRKRDVLRKFRKAIRMAEKRGA
jgi:hypothetical protein